MSWFVDFSVVIVDLWCACFLVDWVIDMSCCSLSLVGLLDLFALFVCMLAFSICLCMLVF